MPPMADSPARRLQRLEDAEAIRNLIAVYGPLADAGKADDVAKLWTEDGEYDVGGYGVAKGRAAIAGLIAGDTHRELMAAGCAHILSPHHIIIDRDRATATGNSMVLRRSGDRFEIWRASTNIWELERRNDGGWLVVRRVNRPIGLHRP